MPVTFVTGNQFNAAAVTADGLYIQASPTTGIVQGVPISTAIIVGTGSWGPVNLAVLNGTPTDVTANHGGITVASVNDPYDLSTHAIIAFTQAQSVASLGVYGIRVSDGTDAAASYTLQDITTGTPLTGGIATALYTGTGGNGVALQIQPGNKANTFNVLVIPPSGPPETFNGIVGNGNNTANSPFWANLQTALSKGITSLRGPSQYLKLTSPSSTAKDPAIGTFMLAGGTDGRAGVTAATLIGQGSSCPLTGLYAGRGLQNPPAGSAWCAGLSDSTKFTTFQAFVDSEGLTGFLSLAQGLSTTAAVAAKQGYGIDDPNITFCKDWIDFYDAANQQVRRIEPTPFIGGAITCLSPEQSPSNKPVYGVVGTERGGNQTPYLQYSPEELGQLASNGIMIVTKPNNGGNYWGMPHGRSSSSNSVMAPTEWGRMINYLVKSFQNTMGQFVGQNQTNSPTDPLRAAVSLALNSFCENLVQAKQIASYLVQCDTNNNTPTTVAQHYLFAKVQVEFLASVWYFVIQTQGGYTTITVQSGQNQQVVTQ